MARRASYGSEEIGQEGINRGGNDAPRLKRQFSFRNETYSSKQNTRRYHTHGSTEHENGPALNAREIPFDLFPLVMCYLGK
jgi:hypothetical protein